MSGVPPTSTPRKARKHKSESEGSNTQLCSLLGISPVTTQSLGDITPGLHGDLGVRKTMEEGSGGGGGLSLQEVIQKVRRPGDNIGDGSCGMKNTQTASRSLRRPGEIIGDGSNGMSKAAEPGPGNKDRTRSHSTSELSSRRESTPESDGGYSTSHNSSSHDYSLAELVRAMNLKAGSHSGPDITQEEKGRGHHHHRVKLSSISELDPAVTQTGRSNVWTYNNHHHTDNSLHFTQGPNLLQTLLGYPSNYTGSSMMTSTTYPDPYWLERAALDNRNAASRQEATCTWSGQLPTPGRSQGGSMVHSCKVFLGGVPWDITESGLVHAFKEFGSIRIEWPGKGRQGSAGSSPKGYLYVILETEGAVEALLSQCTHDYSSGSYYFRISSRRHHYKEVQVIPWLLGDSNFVRCSSQRLDPEKTVFVGALHGMLNAEGLAHIFSDLFGGVVYAGIDTDKYKYPIGSGRVTFSNTKSYMKAVSAAFIEIKTTKFTKKVQVDPYLEDAICSACHLKQGPYFCRDLTCFCYYCRHCWDLHHAMGMQHHKPLMRNTRGGGATDRPVEPVLGLAGQTALFSY